MRRKMEKNKKRQIHRTWTKLATKNQLDKHNKESY